MKFLTKKWAETQFQNFANKVNSIFVKSNDLSTVSFSGDYNDLSEKPNIPTKISQLENDVEYAKTKSPTLTGTPKAPTPSSDTNNTQIATTAFVKTLISNLINGAPETLDTLKEIADALGENKDVVDALEEAISKKANTTDMTAALNNKIDKISGKGLSTNDYTTAEKTKLYGIAEGANKYVHPTTSGNKHIPAGGSSGKILGWSAAGTAEWKDPPSATGNYLPLSGGTLTGALNINNSPIVTPKKVEKFQIVKGLNNNLGRTEKLVIGESLAMGLYPVMVLALDCYDGADQWDREIKEGAFYFVVARGGSSTSSINGDDDDFAIYVIIYTELQKSNGYRYRVGTMYHNSPTTSRFSISTSSNSSTISLKCPKGSRADFFIYKALYPVPFCS